MSRSHRLATIFLPLLTLLTILAFPVAALADGIVIIDPPCPEPFVPPCDDCLPACPDPQPIGDQLDITYHRVRVTIDHQVATTHVEQVFHNPNDWQAEGIYIFPIPVDVAGQKTFTHARAGSKGRAVSVRMPRNKRTRLT